MANDIFVTYLTIYRGNKLPPFYIGSTSLDKIKNGYKGSVLSKEYSNIWKSELKYNPELFYTRIISKHLTRKEALEKELFFHITLNVIRSPLYSNKSNACVNGFFGLRFSKKDHPRYNKKLTIETKSKISKKLKKLYKNGTLKSHGKLNNPGWVVCCDTSGKGLKIKKNEYDLYKNIKYFCKNTKCTFYYTDKTIVSSFSKITDYSFVKVEKYVKPKKPKGISEETKRKISNSKKGKPRDKSVSENMKILRKNTSPAKCRITGTHLGNISKEDPRWISGDIVGIKKNLNL